MLDSSLLILFVNNSVDKTTVRHHLCNEKMCLMLYTNNTVPIMFRRLAGNLQ